MFDHCLYFNTTALSRLLEREWTKAFKPFGLTPPQAFVLRVVLARPGLLQRELAETLTITRPTATRLLDGLEEKKLIQRRRSGDDGRESQVHPTARSLALKDPVNEASAAVTRRLKRHLGDGRFADAVGQMRTIRAELA